MEICYAPKLCNYRPVRHQFALTYAPHLSGCAWVVGSHVSYSGRTSLNLQNTVWPLDGCTSPSNWSVCLTCAVGAPHSTSPESESTDSFAHEGQTLNAACIPRSVCVLVSTPSHTRPIHALVTPRGADPQVTHITRGAQLVPLTSIIPTLRTMLRRYESCDC